tara:strand:- start:3913 stop:11277 length:7365 start_codon:yes stop_codon:yes gene_type:complete
MAQAKDLNISPYYDDFDPSNNFYKVLFKPGFPVQARELTNLQSIAQNQIETFGSHIFKEGSIVIPGAPTFDSAYYAVKLNPTQFGIDISLYTDQLVGKILEGQSSGVTAEVDFVVLPNGNEVEDLTIYVKYLNSGSTDSTIVEFIDGEVLFSQENIVYGNTTISAGTGVVTLISTNATAIGSAAFVSEGVYFIRGTFVNVSSQTLILDYYTNTPSYRVGLKIDEQIISAKDDPSLYDNASGFTNFAAPGADRLKITLTLTKKLLDDKNDQDFFEILRINKGQIRKVKNKTDYNLIRDYLAERTYEESGNYAIDPFSISLVDSLNDRLGNGGIYFSGEKTEQGNTPSDDLMCLKISGGEAYVNGYSVTTDSLTILDADKPRDTRTVGASNVNFEMGNRIVVNNVFGQPQYRKVINLYDDLLDNSGTTGSATLIGEARLYSFNSKDSSYKGPSSEWNLYLYDVNTYTKITLTTTVSATELPATAIIRGLSSNATGYVTAAGSGSTVIYLTQTSGEFIVGEQLSINGVTNTTRTVQETINYNPNDIRSVKQTAVAPYLQDFTADSSLNPVSLPGGLRDISISGTTVTCGTSIPFSGIKVGDVISYNASNAEVPTYNKITSIAPDARSFQVGNMQDSGGVAGVYNGTVQNATFADARLRIAQLWTKDDTAPLYELLPEPNISSVDLLSSSLNISAQITSQSVVGSAATVSIDDVKDGSGAGISTAFFDSYGVSRFSIHYGTASNGVGTVSSDSYNDLNSGGFKASFTGLTDDSAGTLVNVTAKKQGIQSKVKNYEKSKLLDVTLSRLEQSGTDPNTSINDGLTPNSVAYGLRVQDEELSLNVPDVIRVLAVYESINGGQPTFDTVSFNATANVATNAIIGENIVGQSSKAIARVVTNNTSSPSSGGANKLGIVYLNDKVFTNLENVEFKESNIITNIDGINTSDTDAQYQNISKSFTLDKGQRDQYYDYSRIIRKSSSSIPSKRLLIVYDCYTVPSNDTGDVFTVLSYGKDRYKKDIPLIGPSRVRATDTLDFRPRVPVFSGTSSSPFAFSSRTTPFNTTPKFLLSPNGSTILGYDYYLGRIDKIYLNEFGVLTLQKGQSDPIPQPPVNINNSMELATLILPPYLYNPRDAQITLTDNRRYTMRDIGLLEDRIENLEEVTTLSLLEVSTEALRIEDVNGRNRFKSGFFVDSFINDDFVNYNFSSIDVDTERGEIRPIIARNSLQSQLLPASNIIDEEFDSGTNYELLDPNVRKTGNAVTLNYEEVEWLEQSYATRVENVNPFHVVSYRGSITLSPSSDSWVRTIRLDESVSEASETREVDNVPPLNRRRWFFRVLFGRRRDNRPTRTITTTEIQTRSSDVIVNSGDDEFMRSRNTQFSAADLKPQTRYYQFFDGNSDVSFIPKLLEIASDNTLVNSGSVGTFKVGETVIGYIDDQEAISFRVAASNHKEGPFNAPTRVFDNDPYTQEVLQSEYTSSSPILNVDTLALSNEAQGLYSGYVTQGMRLVGQEDGAVAYVKDLRLKSDRYGDVIGSFFLQDPYADPAPMVRIETGRKVYRLSSDANNTTPLRGSKIISSAQSNYESRGTFIVNQIQTVNTTITTNTRELVPVIADDEDPLAQSFTVGGNIEAPGTAGVEGDDNGVTITSVDLFFGNRDQDSNGVAGNSSVTVQIRTVQLGIPTRRLLGTPVVVPSEDITTSTDGSVATNVKFPEPIYLAPGREYAIVLLAPTSNAYDVWIARMGEDAVNIQSLPNVSAIQYNQQWALGSLFKSQNGSIWTPSQTEDLKFKLYKANFTSTTGTAYFANPTLNQSNGYVPTLEDNAIITLPKTGQIGITTLITGNSGITTFTPGRKIVGHSNDGVIAYVVGTGCSVAGASGIVTGGFGYEATVGTVNTFNIVGKGAGYQLNNLTVDANGSITGFGTENVGTGYTGGDIVGLTTSDMTGNIGEGALIRISDNGGIDTLYLSGIQGTNATGGFKFNEDLRYYDNAGVIKNTNQKLLTNLVADAVPNDGTHIKVNEFDHGMHSNQNVLILNNIRSNLDTTVLNTDFTTSDLTISVGSTQSPDFNTFEGIPVGAANTGYARIGDEIIGYESVGAGILESLTRGVDSTLSIPYNSNSTVEKYELNGVSLRRINTQHDISSFGIDLDNYYVGFAATMGRNRSVDELADNIPALSFESEGFFGGSNATGTRNIQYDSIIPSYNVFTPSAITAATATVRTVSGTSVDGTETSFVDQGFSPVQLNTLNTFTTPRVVCSKINETTYLTNIERNKSFTTAITLASGHENVSPIIFTDIAFTEFRSNRINNPVSNYAKTDSVNSPLFDPNSAIYVSSPISLDNPADSLKVIFSAYRGASSDIRVLYSLRRTTDVSEALEEFELFPGYDNLTDSTGNGFGDLVIDPSNNDGKPDAFVPASLEDQYLEYQFTANNLGEFVGYSIKIIMAGTNQADVPKIRELRSIAVR